MTVTVERLADTIGVDINQDMDRVRDTLMNATLMVENYVGEAVVPEPILDLAITRVAQVLWSQESIPSRANDTFYETSEAPSPVNRDPMGTAYVILRKWVLPW